MSLSHSFRSFARLTAEKTLKHREPSLFEIDPVLAAEMGETGPVYHGAPLGQWTVGDVLYSTGFKGEASHRQAITLQSGGTTDIDVIAHFNEYKGSEGPQVYRLLAASGVVYEGSHQIFRPLADEELDGLVAEHSDPETE